MNNFSLKGNAFDFFPLWIEGRKKVFLSPFTSLSLPVWAFDEKASQKSALRIQELGYNTAVLGSFTRSEESEAPSELLETYFKTIKSLNIHVAIKPTFHVDKVISSFSLSPFDPRFIEFLSKEIELFFSLFKHLDFFVYESLALIFDEMGLNHNDEYLLSDIARCEIAFLEEILQGRSGLIYIFPAEEHKGIKSQEYFFKEIALDVDSKTWLVFSGREGNPFLDHLKMHPLLTKLQPKETVGLRCASIVNIGSIHQGGGLWPTVPLDLMHSLYPLLADLNFAPIPCIHGLPLPGSFLEGSLLIASKAIKGSTFFEKELFLWLKKMHQEEEGELLIQVLKEVRGTCILVSWMRSLLSEVSRDSVSQEDTKILALNVLYRLKSLSKQRKNCSKRTPSFQDYLHFFLRDASRIALHFTQSFNIVIQEPWEYDAHKKGFWTEFIPGGGSSLRHIGKVSLFKNPTLEPGCLAMEMIYKDAGWRNFLD